MTSASARLAFGGVALALSGILLGGCAATPAATTSQPASATSSASAATSTSSAATTSASTTSAAASTSSAPASTTTSTSQAAAAAYTLATVAEHATASSCWSVVNGNVYDLTAWIDAHPGGATRIKNMCGKDATSQYTGEHGTEADPADQLATFKLGPLS